MVEMGARRDLRHDAAIGAMLLELRQHEIGADARSPSSLTTAAAVSSQLVSMPRTSMPPQGRNSGKAAVRPFDCAPAALRSG